MLTVKSSASYKLETWYCINDIVVYYPDAGCWRKLEERKDWNERILFLNPGHRRTHLWCLHFRLFPHLCPIP